MILINTIYITISRLIICLSNQKKSEMVGFLFHFIFMQEVACNSENYEIYQKHTTVNKRYLSKLSIWVIIVVFKFWTHVMKSGLIRPVQPIELSPDFQSESI